jgi:hypothetical protein
MVITHALDEANVWLPLNGFKYKGDVKDSTDHKFAVVYTHDGKTVVVAAVRYLINIKGYDQEIIDRHKFVTDQVIELTGKPDYVACLYVADEKTLYIVDNLEIKKESYTTSKGNDINREYNYEKRLNYDIPVNDGVLINFFSWKKKQPTPGESFWNDQFNRYFVDNPIRWVGGEFTHYQLKQIYGWAVDFILYKCNGCIEEGYHKPVDKARRKSLALEKDVKAYFIDQNVEYYKENTLRVGKVLMEISHLFGIELNKQYASDFNNSILLLEEDE